MNEIPKTIWPTPRTSLVSMIHSFLLHSVIVATRQIQVSFDACGEKTLDG